MKRTLQAIWTQDDGVLSFEWVLLATLLTIGIVSGIAGARDAIIDEMSDLAQAAISIDQSYTIEEFNTALISSPGFSYTDDTATDLATFSSCDRVTSPLGQLAQDDNDGGG